MYSKKINFLLMNLFTNKIIYPTIIIFLSSCNLEKKSTPVDSISKKSGKEIYSERCTSCHGIDGKLGFGGAKDLTLSTKSIPEVVNQVTNGKGAMAPYKNILSAEEIDSVSVFSLSLRK